MSRGDILPPQSIRRRRPPWEDRQGGPSWWDFVFHPSPLGAGTVLFHRGPGFGNFVVVFVVVVKVEMTFDNDDNDNNQ